MRNMGGSVSGMLLEIHSDNLDESVPVSLSHHAHGELETSCW